MKIDENLSFEFAALALCPFRTLIKSDMNQQANVCEFTIFTTYQGKLFNRLFIDIAKAWAHNH